MSAPCPVYGFDVVFRLVAGVSDERAAALRDAFVTELVEARGLTSAAELRVGARWANVVRGEGFQATEADREAVAAWAAGRPEIAAAEVGPLVDLAGTV
jgi:uncharacterized protein YggL (DUF469 family)